MTALSLYGRPGEVRVFDGFDEIEPLPVSVVASLAGRLRGPVGERCRAEFEYPRRTGADPLWMVRT